MSADIRLLVGLGNPGASYARTRHNAGWWLVDRVVSACGGSFRAEPRFQSEVAQIRVASESLWVIKPQTFMNRSGQPLQAFGAFYRVEPAQMLVAHDELDLPVGVARLKRGGGHGGHNGLRSLHQHLGPDYARLRIGIGHPGHKDQVTDYVLHRPSAEDERGIQDAVQRGADCIPELLSFGWDRATQRLHSAPPAEEKTVSRL